MNELRKSAFEIMTDEEIDRLNRYQFLDLFRKYERRLKELLDYMQPLIDLQDLANGELKDRIK